jgi:hypothetical protein
MTKSRLDKLLILGVLAFNITQAKATESGYPGWAISPGIAIGNTTAATPTPGVYMFDQLFTYQANIAGPGAPNVGGKPTTISAESASKGVLWVPGWEFFGGTYDAVFVEPVTLADLGNPYNVSKNGLHNSYLAPVELSWKIGTSGVFVKTGLGISGPDGTISGANGLGNNGNPWWTFNPELIVSYLKNGWNVTGLLLYEINTPNTLTGYRTGDVLHAEFAATKTIDRWTFGPVGYYVGQVTNDTSSAFYNYAVSSNRMNIWAAGGLIGYDLGPAALKLWAFKELSADASGGSPLAFGHDPATVSSGYKVYATLSYKIWSPDAPSDIDKGSFYRKAN